MAKDRDRDFARLFSESRDALRRFVGRLVRSQSAADEIVQEAFLQTYAQREEIEIPRAFLFSTARRLASKSHRHDRVVLAASAQDLETALLPGESQSPEERLLAEERVRLLKQAMRRLPRQCRTAFTLRVFQDCSYKEIADRLGISVRTVEKHLALGLAMPRTADEMPTDAVLAKAAVSVLTVGQQVEMKSGSTEIRSVPAPERARVDAWRKGTLYFDDQSLASVVEEANRYTPGQIHIENPELAELVVGGTFEANAQGVDALLLMLEEGFQLQVRRERGHIFVSRAGAR